MVTYPSSWPQCQFGAIVDKIEAGVSVRSYDSLTALPAVLKTSALVNGRFDCTQRKSIVAEDLLRARIKVKPDSLLISRMNTPALVGMVCYVSHAPESVFLPDRIWRVQGKRVNLQWLGYMLSSTALSSQIRELATGTSGSMKNIPKQRLLEMMVPTPLLTEQRAIAGVLSGFDDHLANLDELIAKKKAIRDGALEELITGRTRIADYIDPWVTRSAKELLTDVITGGTPSTAIDEYWNGSIPWLSSTEIHQRMVSRPTRSISEEGLENSSAQIAPAGSVLIALAGQGKTRGTSAFLTRDMALNQSLAGLVVNETKLHREYLLYMLIHRYEDLRGLSSGDGGRGGLNKTLLWNLWFTLPSDLHEQCAIAEVLLGMDQEIRLVEEERAKVERLKSGAMDDLLTGRVRIPIEEEVA